MSTDAEIKKALSAASKKGWAERRKHPERYKPVGRPKKTKEIEKEVSPVEVATNETFSSTNVVSPPQKPVVEAKKLEIETPELVQEVIPDVFEQAKKTAEQEAKSEQDAEKGLDKIFETLMDKWNQVADSKVGEGNPADAYKLTKGDMDGLKNGIVLMDGKYHFLGKSLNFIPELVLGIAVLTIAFKGFKLVQVKRSQPARPNSSSPYTENDVQARVDQIMADLAKGREFVQK